MFKANVQDLFLVCIDVIEKNLVNLVATQSNIIFPSLLSGQTLSNISEHDCISQQRYGRIGSIKMRYF